MKFYIAYSIHNTNTFIRASKVTTDYESTEDGLLLEGVAIIGLSRSGMTNM